MGGIKYKMGVGWVEERNPTPAWVSLSPFWYAGTALPILQIIAPELFIHYIVVKNTGISII